MNAANTHRVVLEPRLWELKSFILDNKQMYPHSAPEGDTLFSKALCYTIIHKKTVHNKGKVSAFAHIYMQKCKTSMESGLRTSTTFLFLILSYFLLFKFFLLPSECKLHDSKDLLCLVLCSFLPSKTAFGT